MQEDGSLYSGAVRGILRRARRVKTSNAAGCKPWMPARTSGRFDGAGRMETRKE